MKIDASQIAQWSREEKLRIMEALWADLSQSDTGVESPAWHEEALNETRARLAAGKERVSDWDEAKRQIRERFD